MRSPICAAAAMLVLSLPVHAQNKCVDARGKVIYQQDPCPESRGAANPAAAPVVAPPPAPKPASPKPPSRDLWRELSELERCKGDWERVAASVSRSRAGAASLRAQGEDASQEEQITRQSVEAIMTRFLPICGKHGFEYPRDPRAEQRNSSAAQALAPKIEAMRAELDAASQLAGKAQAAARGATATPRRGYKECARASKDIERARASLFRLEPARRAAREQAIEDSQRTYDLTCGR